MQLIPGSMMIVTSLRFTWWCNDIQHCIVKLKIRLLFDPFCCMVSANLSGRFNSFLDYVYKEKGKVGWHVCKSFLFLWWWSFLSQLCWIAGRQTAVRRTGILVVFLLLLRFWQVGLAVTLKVRWIPEVSAVVLSWVESVNHPAKSLASNKVQYLFFFQTELHSFQICHSS